MPVHRYRDEEIAGRLGGMLGRFEAGRSVEVVMAEYARKFSADERKKLAKEGKALSDGSYPISDESSLRDAETLAKSGHGNVSAASALIKKRAKELGVAHKMDAKEKSAAATAIDPQVRKAIEGAISLQQKDPDLHTHDADRRVLELLHSALQAQLRDEATDAPAKGGGGLY